MEFSDYGGYNSNGMDTHGVGVVFGGESSAYTDALQCSDVEPLNTGNDTPLGRCPYPMEVSPGVLLPVVAMYGNNTDDAPESSDGSQLPEVLDQTPSDEGNDAAETSMYKEGVFAVSTWTMPVETASHQAMSSQASVEVVDIGCLHTCETAKEIADAIIAHGCGVVAQEVFGWSPDEVADLERALNSITCPEQYEPGLSTVMCKPPSLIC